MQDPSALPSSFLMQVHKIPPSLRLGTTMESSGTNPHGRVDERSYFLTKVPTEEPVRQDWPSANVIGYALRVTQAGNAPETVEVWCYIASRYLSGKRFSVSLLKRPGQRQSPRPDES
ncbi:hypothetical protein [Planctellipticum variicoloris]|uniref:hypothetical protein n=1 Tax=Planctellipticum variicoloris TaxID=3064265 RepID=UPI00301350A5|nr:hypothetical protein SH412_003881 [Planctomycetaceae bacterium SH412]